MAACDDGNFFIVFARLSIYIVSLFILADCFTRNKKRFFDKLNVYRNISVKPDTELPWFFKGNLDREYGCPAV